MTAIKLLGVAVLALGLVLANQPPVQAADTHPVKLPCTTVISGVDLLPGEYNIHWDVNGSRGTVRFSRQGRVVATVQGVVSKLEGTSARDTLFFHKHSDGFITVTALALGGTDTNIVFPLVAERPRRKSDFRINSSAADDLLSSPHFGRRMNDH